MAIITLENIQFKYPDSYFYCLNNININFYDCELAGLTGPNGAGKTTLLKIICGLIKAFSGDVKIYGKSINKYSNIELARIISYIPQSDNYIFDFTVKEIVEMGRRPYINSFGVLNSHDREIVSEVIEILDLKKIINRRFLSLSSGEKRMVSIARALAQESKILLMDEPTNNLDLNHKIIFMDKITKLNKMGKTIILISHDINLISEYLNRIIFIKEGQVMMDGSVTQILNEKNLKDIFHIDNFFISKNQITKKPNVFFIPKMEV